MSAESDDNVNLKRFYLALQNVYWLLPRLRCLCKLWWQIESANSSRDDLIARGGLKLMHREAKDKHLSAVVLARKLNQSAANVSRLPDNWQDLTPTWCVNWFVGVPIAFLASNWRVTWNFPIKRSSFVSKSAHLLRQIAALSTPSVHARDLWKTHVILKQIHTSKAFLTLICLLWRDLWSFEFRRCSGIDQTTKKDLNVRKFAR